MILFWVLWVSLVLGGVAGCLAARAKRTGLWPRAARVPAPARRAAGRRDAAVPPGRHARADFLPVPRVTTRSGSPPGRLS
jgi:hypothetical protein